MWTNNTDLDVSNPHTWLSLMAFFFTIICAITSPNITPVKYWHYIRNAIKKMFGNKSLLNNCESLNESKEWFTLAIDLGIAPIIAIALLFMTTSLSATTFADGVLGNDKIKPYSVLVLFMSLAYCCLSLELTGLFEYIAVQIMVMAANSGTRLYFGFCLFASVLTVFTSNDIVIMTLTPIICSASVRTENLDPIPFVVSQFFLANIWSMTLVIGNPTNIIVAEAVGLNFVNYTKWMALPTIGAGLTCQLLLYLLFRRRIPKRIIEKTRASVVFEPKISIIGVELNRDEMDSETERPNQVIRTAILQHKLSAAIKSVCLLLCLASLAVVSVVQPIDGLTVYSYMVTALFFLIFLAIDMACDVVTLYGAYKSGQLVAIYEELLVWRALKRMPWKIIPFALGMFIMVAVLKFYGYVGLFARLISRLINSVGGHQEEGALSFGQDLRSTSSAVFIITYLSSIACNVLNNQPMTILFTDMLLSDDWIAGTANMWKGSQLGLIIGSNLGANITLIGALAGILWINILRQFDDPKITGVNFFLFLKFGLMITPIVIFVESSVLVIQLLLMS